MTMLEFEEGLPEGRLEEERDNTRELTQVISLLAVSLDDGQVFHNEELQFFISLVTLTTKITDSSFPAAGLLN